MPMLIADADADADEGQDGNWAEDEDEDEDVVTWCVGVTRSTAQHCTVRYGYPSLPRGSRGDEPEKDRALCCTYGYRVGTGRHSASVARYCVDGVLCGMKLWHEAR